MSEISKMSADQLGVRTVVLLYLETLAQLVEVQLLEASKPDKVINILEKDV